MEYISEEQGNILKELKTYEADPPFRNLDKIEQGKKEHVRQQTHNELQIIKELRYDAQHQSLRQKLMEYRQKSDQIYRVGQLLQTYEHKFAHLLENKQQILTLLSTLKGSTSELVSNQQRMIDLSMQMKEALDYYSYMDRFSFDWVCEVGCRDMFEEALQPVLSQLIDGYQFFKENHTYVNAKKYANLYAAGKTKVLSFVKSFLIKLFNKENAFSGKYCKQSLDPCLDTFRPKSKLKFLLCFINFFPQFRKHLKQILQNAKQSTAEEQLKSAVESRQLQIAQFQLSQPNLSLISYLYKYMPQTYFQAVFTLPTFNRTSFHQSYLKMAAARPKDLTPAQYLKCRFTSTAYLLSGELAYLSYVCRASQGSKEGINSTISKIAMMHLDELIKIVKEIKNRQPFEMAQGIEEVSSEFGKFWEEHRKEEYEMYAYGCISKESSTEDDGIFIKDLIQTLAGRLKQELQHICFALLPNIPPVLDKGKCQNAIRTLIQNIPRLRFCPQHAQRYLVSSLQTIIKYIRQINTHISSRFECYVWNLQMFGGIRQALRSTTGEKLSLIRKQLKLDMNNSSNIVERVRHIHSDTWMKYALDVFDIIKTGMPIINEMTLDYGKYISDHYQALQSQFAKDILFIYAKNMIEFLQKLSDSSDSSDSQAKGKQICQPQAVKSLYSSYLLSIDKFIHESNEILILRQQFKLSPETGDLIISLLDEVHDRLFDLLNSFYVMVSKYVSYTEEFEEIGKLKEKYKNKWVVQIA